MRYRACHVTYRVAANRCNRIAVERPRRGRQAGFYWYDLSDKTGLMY